MCSSRPVAAGLEPSHIGVVSWLMKRQLWAGVTHIPSPGVRFGHPALRSLRGNCASPSWLRWLPRPARGHGRPRPGRPAREACVPADPWPQAWSLRNTPSTTKDVDCILKPSGFGQAASLPPLVNRQAVLRGLVTPRHAAGEARAACHPPFAPWPPTRVGSGLRHAAGEARAACHPGRPASTSIRADRATTPQRPHAIGRPEGGRPGGGPASPAGPGMARRALKNQARRALKPHGRQRCGRGRSRAALGLPGGSGPRGADSGCERDSQRVD